MNLALSGVALALSGAALLIARKQVTLDERSLRLAEREYSIAEQERAARSALVVNIDWEPDGGVSRTNSINAAFAVKVAIRNDGARDATDVVVALLVAATMRNADLYQGRLVPKLEQREVDGTTVQFHRYERRAGARQDRSAGGQRPR